MIDMKICVIGNSHVGSLKRAWDAMPEHHKTTEIVFFADRAQGMKGMGVDGGKLVPGNERLKKSLEFTSGGEGFIDPEKYDMFLVYGVGARGFFINPSKHYSSAVIDQAANDHVLGGLSFELVKNIRKVTDKRIYVGHDPLPAWKGGEFSAHHPEAYLHGLNLINEKVFSRINSQMVNQPLETVVNGRNTNPEFSKGSKRLSVGRGDDDKEHPETDFGHMNDEFGAAWMTSFLESVRQ